MDDNIALLIINSLIYIFSFFVYQRRIGSIQVGSIIIGLYAVISIGSVYLYSVNEYWDFQEITLFPLLYLYAMLFFSFRPLLLFSTKKIEKVVFPNDFFMRALSCIIFFVYFFFFIQTILSSFSLGDLLNEDVLLSNYSEKGDNIENRGGINVFGVLKVLFADLLWIVFMYNFVKRHMILSIMSLFSIVVAIFTSLAWGSRGGLISVVLEMLIAYFVFKPLMLEKQKKLIKYFAISILSLISVGFFALTFGRFGDSNRYSILEILAYYLSSNFIMFDNYALDPGGCRYGDRVFPLVRLLLGLDTAKDFMSRRDMYPNLKLDDSQFSSFVGEFCIDFGPYFTVIIILFFSCVFMKVFKKDVYDFGDILLGLFLCKILTYGYALFPYAEIGGNIGILYVLFFVFMFKRMKKISVVANGSTSK